MSGIWIRSAEGGQWIVVGSGPIPVNVPYPSTFFTAANGSAGGAPTEETNHDV